MDINLPAIDILNALDYRMKCLANRIANAITGLPESAEELQSAVNEIIAAGSARKSVNRKGVYSLSEYVEPQKGTPKAEALYDLFLDGVASGQGLTAEEVDSAMPPMPPTNVATVIRVYLTGTKVDKTDRFLI